MEGVVTVFEAFSVNNQMIGLQIGDQPIVLRLDRQGVASMPTGSSG